jgi:hypothetical protein
MIGEEIILVKSNFLTRKVRLVRSLGLWCEAVLV